LGAIDLPTQFCFVVEPDADEEPALGEAVLCELHHFAFDFGILLPTLVSHKSFLL
jgi:hypothetical protein